MRKKPALHEREPHKTILLAIHRRYTLLMRKPLPPPWMTWSYERDLRQRIDGPKWRPREWFNEAVTAAHAKALQRALIDLEDGELVEATYRAQRVKLTEAGLTIVRRLKRRDRANAKALAILKSRPVSQPRDQAV